MPTAAGREYPLPTSILCLLLALATQGCGTSPQPALPQKSSGAPTLAGLVKGGQQPISNATIQLYAASTTANADPATPLLIIPAHTSPSGSFSITGTYTCPDPSSLVYLVATGGNPGLAAGSTNPAIALMTALGPCNALTSTTFIAVDEVTTVATVAALTPYMNSYAALGTSSFNLQQLASAFTTVTLIINTASGTIPGPAMPAGYLAPTQNINTLANILAACVNSNGGVPGDSSACSRLFAATTQPGPNPAQLPTDTVAALLQILRNPASSNLPALFTLATPGGPFQPTLASVPSTFAITIQPAVPLNLPQRSNLLGEYLLTEGSGTQASDTSGLSNHATLVGPTWEGTTGLNFAIPGQYLNLPSALNQANSWMFALYSPPLGFATYPQPPGYGNPSDFGGNPSLLCGSTQLHTCLIASSYFKPLSQSFFAFNTDATEAAQPIPAGWHIVLLVGGQNGNPDHIFYDGVEVPYAHQGSGMFTHPSTGSYQIGGSDLFISTWFIGKIAAAWAWSTSLSPNDAPAAYSSALNFLHVKGAAPTYAPVVHRTPLIIAGLDSRTQGEGVTLPWPNLLNLTDSSYTTLNLGFYASTNYDHVAMFDALHAPQILANTAPTIEIFWGGSNDFHSTNMSIRTIADSLKALTHKSKALGAKVIIATEISSHSVANGDESKNTLNTIIRAEAFSWGADNIADLATIPPLGTDGAYADTRYFNDNVHPTDLAETLIAQVMSNAVNELIGSTPSAHHATSAYQYQEQAGDLYLNLTADDPQSITLPDCTGYSLPRHITNLGPTTATMNLPPTQNQIPTQTQITNLLPPNTSAIYTPIPVSSGCTWNRTQ